MIKRNIFWAILNSTSSTLISLGSSIYIARSIIPSHYLQLSIIFSFIALSNVIIDFGASNQLLLMQSISADDIHEHEGNMFYRAIIMFIAYIVIIVATYHHIELSLLMLILPSIHIFCYPYNFFGNLYYNRNILFKEKLVFSSTSSLIAASCAIYLTYLGLPEFGFISSQILSPFLLGLFLRIKLKNSILPNFSYIYSFRVDRSISSSFYSQLFENVYILSSKSLMFSLSPNLLAPLYVKNDSFLMLPFKLLKKSINRVTISILGPLSPQSSSFSSSFFAYIISSIFLSILIFVFVVKFGASIVLIAIGSKWVLPGAYYNILGLHISLHYLSSQSINQLNIYKKSFATSSRINFIAFFSILLGSCLLYLNSNQSTFKIFIILAICIETYKIIHSLSAMNILNLIYGRA